VYRSAPQRHRLRTAVTDSQADLQTVLADRLSGRYRHSLHVVAFDTVEGCTRAVTAAIARKALSCGVELDRELLAAVLRAYR
jgi:hypothetical protein